MPDHNEWYKTIQPLSQSESDVDAQRISRRVLEQLPHAAERKEIMEEKKKTHPIRNVFFAIAAVLCVGTASAVTANAVTEGELFDTITVYLNGESLDADIHEVVNEDGSTAYEATFSNEDGSLSYDIVDDDIEDATINIEENDDTVIVEYDVVDGEETGSQSFGVQYGDEDSEADE